MSPAVRPYRPGDREGVVEVCVRTARDGEDARGTLATPELYAEIWALPYLALEPDLAFVLAEGEQVLGYVLGTADTDAFAARAESEWFPAARARHPVARDAREQWLVDLLHAPAEPLAEHLRGYPAHLHVDLLPEAQGAGWGRRLLETFFAALRERGVPGVHLGAATHEQGPPSPR